MEEYALNWQVLLVIVFILGFATAIIKPILKLNTTLNNLDYSIKTLHGQLERNMDEHCDIYDKLDGHEDTLIEHDKSISELRYKIGG